MLKQKLSSGFAVLFGCWMGLPSSALADVDNVSWPIMSLAGVEGLRVDVDLNCYSSIGPDLVAETVEIGEDLKHSCPWTYTIKLKVEGRIPTDGAVTWGAAITVNDVQVIESQGGNGNSCSMEDFDEEILVMVAPGETIGLKYWHNGIDINDGYAEITSASIVKAEVLQTCNGSSCERGQGIMAANHSLGVDLLFGMPDTTSEHFGKKGCLRLYHQNPNPNMYHPFGLCYMNRNDGAEVILDMANKGCIRQVKGVDGLMDIISNPGNQSFDINFYRPEDVGSKSGDYYSTTAPAYETITVRNPGSLPHASDRVEIVTSSGTTEFQWVTADQSWTLIHADDEARERRYASTTGNIRTEVLEVMDHVSQVVEYREEEKYELASWGEPMVSRILNPGASNEKVTQYLYWTNSSDNGFKQIRQINHPGGKWECFDYDSSGRLSRKMTSLLDNGFSTNTNLCRVTEFDYAALSGSGDNLSHTNTPRTTVEFVGGKEVSRSYRVFKNHEERSIECQTPGAAWNAVSNLVTITKYVSSGTYSNKLASIEFPDGHMELRQYSGIGNYFVTTLRGEPNASKTSILSGKSTFTARNLDGRLTKITEASFSPTNYWAASTFYGIYDDKGRYQWKGLPGNASEEYVYGCCGMTQMTARDGSITQWTYDELGRKTAQTTPGAGQTGNSWTYYEYNSRGQLVQETQTGQSQPLRSMSYGLDGSLLSETNGLGGVTTYVDTFDSGNGRYTKTTTYPDGGTRIERHYLDGRLESVTGTAVAGQRWEYAVEQLNGVWCRTTKTIALDSNGNDTLEWTKSYTDALGRIVRTEYADPSTPLPYDEFIYNDKGQLIEQRDADGTIHLFAYNAQGQREIEAIDVDQDHVIDYGGGDRITRTVSYDDGTNRDVATYQWLTDSSTTETLVRRETQTYNTQTVTEYQDGGNTAVTSTVTTLDPTNRSRTTTTTYPSGDQSQQIYVDGLMTQAKTLDSTGGLRLQTDYTYDVVGRVSQESDFTGTSTQYSYNDAGLAHSVTRVGYASGGSQTTTTLYDGNLRPTQIIHPNGGVENRDYELSGQLKKQYGSQTFPVEYTYDDQGRVRTQKTWTDYAGSTGAAITRWNYDAYRGWLLSKDYPNEADGLSPAVEGSGGPSYTHTAAGRVATQTWQGGTVKTLNYDGAGLLSQISYSDATPTQTFTYNRRGQAATVSLSGSPSQLTSFVYNDAGQIESESHSQGILGGLSVHHVYDNQGRRTQTRLESGVNVLSTIDYDWSSVAPSIGRLNGITHGGKTLAYSYRSDNLLSRVKDGTIYEHNRTYDNLKRLSYLETKASSTPIPMGFTLQYNKLNQRIRVEREDQSYWLYQYDDLGQLKQAQRYWKDRSSVDGQGFTYNYDDIGNRVDTGGRLSSVSTYSNNYRNELDDHSVAAVVDVQGLANPTANVTVNGYVADRKKEYFHKALSIDNSTSAVYTNLTITSTYGGGQTATGKVYLPQTPENFTYDHDGNLLSDGRWDYEWDGENRLIEMTAIGSFPTGVPERLEFTYDYQGRRIGNKVYDAPSGGTLLRERRYVYDGWHLLAELDGSNNLVRSYVWGIDLSGSIGGAGGVGGLLKIIDHGVGGSSHYVAYDANGNVVGLVDATSGAWTAQYEYGPFGELIRATGPMAASNPFRFSTKYTDDESGLLYYGMRYYNPTTGRWISRDPIGEDGGLNLYGFVGNDPLGHVDHLGQTRISSILRAFFWPWDRGEGLWVMDENDSYTQIVREWNVVQSHIERLKLAVAADPETWIKHHITSPGWSPSKSFSPDPNHGWNELEFNPPGTDPNTARNHLILYGWTGFASKELHISSIGSFRIVATADEISGCRAKLNVWMYNEMSRESFGRFAEHPFFSWRPMRSQFMWWNWKEEFVFNHRGEIVSSIGNSDAWF